LLFAQTRFHRPDFNSGNFTATNSFGNFTGSRPFGNVTPYGGFVNGLTVLAVIISIVGILWLGMLLKKTQIARI